MRCIYSLTYLYDIIRHTNNSKLPLATYIEHSGNLSPVTTYSQTYVTTSAAVITKFPHKKNNEGNDIF